MISLKQAGALSFRPRSTLLYWIHSGRLPAVCLRSTGWRVTEQAMRQAEANHWSPPQRLANKVSNELLSAFGGGRL